MRKCFLAGLVCVVCAATVLPSQARAQESDAMPADSIDGRGDINDNGQAYEVADFVLFGWTLVKGAWVLPIPERGTFHSDVNDDGTAMGLDDWVYLARVVIGDAQPFPRPTLVNDTAVITHDDLNGKVSVGFARQLAVVLLVFDGSVTVTSVAAGIVPDIYFDGHLTRILVARTLIDGMSDSIPTFPDGDLITYSGTARLIGAAVADAEGLGTVPVEILGGSDIGRGDINGNNIPYDPADFLDYRSYHLTGFDDLAPDTQAVRMASNVNGDGYDLTLEDVLYLHQIIMTQAPPIAGDANIPDSLLVAIQDHLNRKLLQFRPEDAGAAYYRFDRPVELSFLGDTSQFLFHTETVANASSAMILPRLLPDTTTLYTLPDLPITYDRFAVLDSIDAAAYRLVRYYYQPKSAPVPVILVNDTVYNIVTIEHPELMIGARMVFEGGVQPQLLVDSFAFEAPAGGGATVVSVLPASPFSNATFAAGAFLTYSGRGILADGSIASKYAGMQDLSADIVITAGLPGDVTMDDRVDALDLTWLIDYLFSGIQSPLGIQAADLDRDGYVTPIDLAYVVDYIYGL